MNADRSCNRLQCHPKRKTCAKRFFFNGFEMSSLCKVPRTLTHSGHDPAIGKLHRTPLIV